MVNQQHIPQDAELGPGKEDPIHKSVTEIHRMRVVIERSWTGPLFYGGRLSPQVDSSDRADSFAERGDLSTTRNQSAGQRGSLPRDTA